VEETKKSPHNQKFMIIWKITIIDAWKSLLYHAGISNLRGLNKTIIFLPNLFYWDRTLWELGHCLWSGHLTVKKDGILTLKVNTLQ